MAATKTELSFNRRRHLALAIVGLAHGLVFMLSGYAVLPLLGRGRQWTAEAYLASDLVGLSFAALVAWLALVAIPTGAQVSVRPRRWRDLGPWFVAWCVLQESFVLLAVCLRPAESYEVVGVWMSLFGELGQLRIGLLGATVFVGALAEEIVYRVLLLPALEGYLRPKLALVIHAAIFELVHALIYGMGFSGVPFLGGLVLGYAFQRTRSLAVPTLLHAGHNFLFLTLVWYLNQ